MNDNVMRLLEFQVIEPERIEEVIVNSSARWTYGAKILDINFITGEL